MVDEALRSELSKKISDYLFSYFQWGSSAMPIDQEPKMRDLLVDVLEYQRLNHPRYGRYCSLQRCTERGTSILSYPPLPVESFKRADICPFGQEQTVAEFRSSGTTEGVKSIHRFRDTGLLQRALIYTFTLYISRLMPKGMRFLSLMPSYESNPHSSLGYMITQFVQNYGAEGSGFFFDFDRGLDCNSFVAALRDAERDGVAVHIFGPAFAYVELLDWIESSHIAPIHCAPGSCLLETGGYKGRTREIPKAELRQALCDKLGIEIGHIYGEYGMCELSSQGYEICALNNRTTRPDECLYIFPGWMKCMLFNPETMAPVLPGHEGQIAFFDLCNLDSAAYILTGDVGTLVELPPDVRRATVGFPKYGLRLRGRAPSAVPKGCSMAWDEWNAQARDTSKS